MPSTEIEIVSMGFRLGSAERTPRVAFKLTSQSAVWSESTSAVCPPLEILSEY